MVLNCGNLDEDDNTNKRWGRGACYGVMSDDLLFVIPEEKSRPDGLKMIKVLKLG